MFSATGVCEEQGEHVHETAQGAADSLPEELGDTPGKAVGARADQEPAGEATMN